LNRNNFAFNNLILYDSLGNSASINGTITHNSFKDFTLDINLKATDLSCLNTSFYQNDEFFGSVFFTGDVDLKGPVNDINININGKTERKTSFNIPLSSTSVVGENTYITFINPLDSLMSPSEIVKEVSNMNLNLSLKVTSEASIEIIMPSQSGNIRANGDGFIKMEIDPSGNFNIYGDYIISKGSYLFTLQNVINKHFTIRPGGSIKWNGDPYDADINIRAVYSIRAPLSGLMMATDSSGAIKQRIPVDCILDLQGKLFNPEISFSIELPDSDHETQQLVYSQIDTTNQSQMS
jgi:hypothetical protein